MAVSITPFWLFTILILPLLSGHDAAIAVASKQGILGFGISLYPDLCCQACHDSLSSLYLTCTTFEHGGSSTPTAGWGTTWWFWCDLYYAAAHGTLGEFAREEYLHTRYFVTSLPLILSLLAPASLSNCLKIRIILYLVVIGICVACGLLAQTASMSPNLHRQKQTLARRSGLQQAILLPALLGSRHLEPLPGRIGYLPSRVLSISVGLYIVLNIIFSAVSFRSFQPNIWFLSAKFELCEYVGNRTGTLSLANMSIAILFAARNNLLIALTGLSQTTFLTLHRWTARVATAQAVVHSIVYTLAYFEPGYGGAAAYTAKTAEPFYWWGIIAIIALCLAVAFAVLPIRIRFYETFLALHIVLVILARVGCWYHLVPHFGFDYGYQVWLVPLLFAFWAADRLARLGRTAYYNRLLAGSKALVEAIPGCPDGNIMQITVFPRTIKGFGRPGQHTFLYFFSMSGGGKLWEGHPFSVAGWKKTSPSGQEAEDERPCIRLLVRAHAGMTSTPRRHLQQSSREAAGGSVELSSIYTEGLYPGHRATLAPLFAADTVVCFAEFQAAACAERNQHSRQGEEHGDQLENGERLRQQHRGVGGLSARFKAQRLILAWSARERGLIEHVRRKFLGDGSVNDGMVEYMFWCTGGGRAGSAKADSGDYLPQGHVDGNVPATEKGVSVTQAAGDVKSGRMDIESVLRMAVETGRHQTAVLVCAPGGMADEVTKHVVRCVKGGFRVDLVEEAFAW
ncbi:ferric reductase like transmembrane component-domain-containing protein [Apodospora peruviana]|uniref:Ferric reductase like transmembrane component-domain-containing protein n=1 Tax=Apodospora peruviana TaxID=516989 RepID=A0AAE0I790_9PEZI|nr:ferric reductase like transmembrane component-domain-containing protein [Apodospora peruviana]